MVGESAYNPIDYNLTDIESKRLSNNDGDGRRHRTDKYSPSRNFAQLREELPHERVIGEVGHPCPDSL